MARQIDSLTGVRGIAMSWVVLLHGSGYVSTESVLPESITDLIKMGWLGVDLFFLLSGFVISYVHQTDFTQFKANSYSRFLKLRLARIYPAHFVATMALLPVVAGATLFSIYEVTDSQYSFSRLLYSLFLLNGWGLPNSVGWNIPSWSVGSEWFAYICFPFIAYVFNRLRSPWMHVLIIIMVFTLMITLAVFIEDMKQYMLGENLTLTRVTSEFLIGCSLFNIYRNVPEHKVFDFIALCSSVVMILLSATRIPPFYDFLIIGTFALLILSLSRSLTFAAKLFSISPLLYLGKISYSVYLTHATVLMIVNQILIRLLHQNLDEVTYFWAFYLIYIACAIAVGHVLYVTVEQPARTYLRDRWRLSAQAS